MNIQRQDRRCSRLEVRDCPKAHCLANIPLHQRVGVAVPVEPFELADAPERGEVDWRVHRNLGCAREHESPYVAESVDAARPGGRPLRAHVQARQRHQEVDAVRQ